MYPLENELGSETGIEGDEEYSSPSFTVIEKQIDFKELQEMVGGWVEVIYLENGNQILMDEEGLRKNLPLNQRATYLTGRPIVGNVVMLTGKGKLK